MIPFISARPVLGKIPLFEGLPDSQLDDLVRISSRKTYDRGETVFSEGDQANGFYILTAGRIKVYKLSPDGKEQILHIIDPGDPFGEVAVFAGTVFPAHAETLESSEVLFMPREGFVDLIRKDPSLSLNMLAVLSRRLRQFTVLVEHLSLKEVPQRLAAFLLYLSSHQGDEGNVHLSVTKGQLASLLGTIPETLSRILGKMAGQNMIRVDGRHITILDKQGLSDLQKQAKSLP